MIPVYEAGEWEGQLFLAMRYVEGTDLGAIIACEEKLHPRRAAPIIAQVASALDAAHGRGLVHRDVKPGERPDREARRRPARLPDRLRALEAHELYQRAHEDRALGGHGRLRRA